VPKYFFDFSDGKTTRDPVGQECAGCEEIRTEVMRGLPEIAAGKIPGHGEEQAFTVAVRNEDNITVYTATVTFAGRWLGADIPPPEEPFD